MPTLLQAALLGILQGLTEFLPISSTAHLLIGERLLAFPDPGGVFTVMIQLGSILAVMWLYRLKISEIGRGLRSNAGARRFVLALLSAVVPAAVAGALFADYVKTVLYSAFAVTAASFVIGGILMIVVERFRPPPSVHEADEVTIPRAIGIGLCQVLSLVPGVSRSGATIVGGMAFGLGRGAAAEFSFFLAMPTMVAAFTHDLLEVRGSLAPDLAAELAIGFAMAFFAALLVVKPFVRFVRRSGFMPFAWYRIVVGVLLFAALAAGWP